ncbi:MAG TPA: recombinase family protein, partial [Burkholderiaceae bacterium]|nr:recombinase family protein [Burkholderiaceae bacterium]
MSRHGRVSGALAYSRGALYALLKNRLYRGEIAYRGAIYPGDHAAIVERALWERVQQHLGVKRKARHEGERGRMPSLLVGLVYDHSGERYTPSHTLQHAKRYRYYVAPRPPPTGDAGRVRIPAEALEALVVQRLQQLLSDQLALLDALSAPGDDAALLQALLNAASARSRAWPTLTPEQLRQLVRAVVVRITVAPDALVLALNKGALRSLLLPGAS